MMKNERIFLNVGFGMVLGSSIAWLYINPPLAVLPLIGSLLIGIYRVKTM